MKFIRIILFLCLCSTQSFFAQEEALLLEIEEPWRSERLAFPISFAPSLDYKGIEEVRFAKGWGNSDSEEFWTYTFLWYLDEDPKTTEVTLQNDIEAYFNGLMNVVGKGKEIPQTNAVFVKKEKIGTATTYVGKVKVFDAFFTKSIQTLQVKIVADYCEQQKKHTVLFTFSPQPYTHDVWKTLDGITMSQECK